MTVRDTRQSQTVRMAAHAFQVVLPVGSVDVRVVELSLGDDKFELTVSRPVR